MAIKLSEHLQKSVIELLKSIPDITTRDARQALLVNAYIDNELKNQINIDNPPGRFVPLLVSTALDYGVLKNGQLALIAILEAAKNLWGQESKTKCERLILDIQKFQLRDETLQQADEPSKDIIDNRIEDYKYDIFLSYDEEVERWVGKHFVASLNFCLRDEFGDYPKIFYNKQAVSQHDPWPESLREALAYSRCLISLWSPGYFIKPWWRYECSAMLDRKKKTCSRIQTASTSSALILPFILCDGQTFPEEAKKIAPQFQLNQFVVPETFVDAFNQSPTCIQFHEEMRKHIKQIAHYIKSAPPWNQDWLNEPEYIIPESPKPHFRYPTLW